MPARVDVEEWLESGPGRIAPSWSWCAYAQEGLPYSRATRATVKLAGGRVRSDSDRVVEMLFELGVVGDLLAARCDAAVRAGVRERVVWTGDRCLVSHGL